MRKYNTFSLGFSRFSDERSLRGDVMEFLEGSPEEELSESTRPLIVKQISSLRLQQKMINFNCLGTFLLLIDLLDCNFF